MGFEPFLHGLEVIGTKKYTFVVVGSVKLLLLVVINARSPLPRSVRCNTLVYVFRIEIQILDGFSGI